VGNSSCLVGIASRNRALTRSAFALTFVGTNPTVASGTVKRLASVQTQCCEIHGVDLLVATVRPKFQPPPKARYSPTRLVVTDV